MERIRQNGVVARVFVNERLNAGQAVLVTEQQAHYLRNVMRARNGALAALFNGQDGEWLAEVERMTKNECSLRIHKRMRKQESEDGPWLLFAPIKQLRLDYLIQKSVELGVELIWPIRTLRTMVRNINSTRIRANAIEASEQCGRLTVPQMRDYTNLAKSLDNWPPGRTLFWGDETGGGAPALGLLQSCVGKAAFLIGPEGGFDDTERDLLNNHDFTQGIDLGPRLLRSDTASLVVMALWQSAVQNRTAA